jgi:hypothetical protein
MDTSKPSRPEGSRTSAKADARGASRAYWVSFSLREEAAPLARIKAGASVLTGSGRKVAECWRSLGEGRPWLEPDALSVGPRSVQGILRLDPGHPQAVTLSSAARLFKALSARLLAEAGEGPAKGSAKGAGKGPVRAALQGSAAGIWKQGFTGKPLETLKQVVEAQAAFKARTKTPAQAKKR